MSLELFGSRLGQLDLEPDILYLLQYWPKSEQRLWWHGEPTGPHRGCG
jgi:hypothetical protein